MYVLILSKQYTCINAKSHLRNTRVKKISHFERFLKMSNLEMSMENMQTTKTFSILALYIFIVPPKKFWSPYLK